MIQKIPLNLPERLAEARLRTAGPIVGADGAASSPLSDQDPAMVEGADPGVLRSPGSTGTDPRPRRGFAALLARAEKLEAETPTAPPSPILRVEDAGSDSAERDLANSAAPAAERPGDTHNASANFDLPTFLRVLPSAGAEVAVAAARDPAMAQALRQLPRSELQAEAPAGVAGAVADIAPELPSFLLQARPTVVASADSEPRVRLPDPALVATLPGVAVGEGSRQSPPRRLSLASSEVPGAPRSNESTTGTERPAVRSASPGASAALPTMVRTREEHRSATQRAITPAVVDGVGLRVPEVERLERLSKPLAFRVMPATAAVPLSSSGIDPASAPMVGHSAADPGPVSDLPQLREPVGTEAWQDELSAQLSVMTEQGERSEAVMKLAPEGLGELEIRVEVHGSEAVLQFGAASAEARQALELAQTRLRDLLSAHGVRVSEFSVFSNLSGNHQNDSNKSGQPRAAGVRLDATGDDRVTELRAVVSAGRSAGVLDLYA